MSDCDCNATPYAPVLPTSQCEGTRWMGFEKKIHEVGEEYLSVRVDVGATPSTFNQAMVDLWISSSVEVIGGAGSPTPVTFALALHSSAIGSGTKVLDTRTVDLQDEEAIAQMLTVQGFVPAGSFWSLRISQVTGDVGGNFIFYQVGAKT